MDEDYMNDNYVYSQDDLDTSNQFTPSQGVDDFLGNQGNYQIDGNYFGQAQDWGNQNWGMENQQNSFGGMPELQGNQGQSFAPPPAAGGNNSMLEKIFNNPLNFMKMAGGLQEMLANKKKGDALKKMQGNQQMLDPFGSQRPFYQQELQRAVTNPYDSPMVKSQVDNLQRMQNIKDAAAGRRSNQLSSAPGVLAQQAAIAQEYMKSLQGPAGANLQPNAGAWSQLGGQAAGYNAQGMSPLFSAGASMLQDQQNQELLQKLFSGRG